MRKAALNIIRLAFGLFVLAILFLKIGIEEIVKTISGSNILILFLAPLVYITSIFISSQNVKLLSDTVRKIPSWSMFRYSMFTTSISLFLPGKLGGFSMVYFLKKEGIPIGEATSILTVDKIITVAVLGTFSVIGASFLFGIVNSVWLLLVLFALIVAAIFVLYSDLSRGLIKRYILRGYSAIFKGFSKIAIEFVKNHKWRIGVNAGISLAKFLFNGLVPFTIFLALGQNVGIMYILLIMCAELSVAIIPITLNGLGLRESIGFVLYSSIGIPPAIIAGRYVIGLINKYSVAALGCLALGNIK